MPKHISGRGTQQPSSNNDLEKPQACRSRLDHRANIEFTNWVGGRSRNDGSGIVRLRLWADGKDLGMRVERRDVLDGWSSMSMSMSMAMLGYAVLLQGCLSVVGKAISRLRCFGAAQTALIHDGELDLRCSGTVPACSPHRGKAFAAFPRDV